MVSSSFLASYSVTGFYTGVVLMISALLRPNLIFFFFMAFLYETTHPDPIIKLIECCYMKRHEEDLVGEEETYRMLQEIVRQPELFKSLCGTSLKNTSMDPVLDKMNEATKKKLDQLNKMERKGFEVQQLKHKLMDRHMEKWDEEVPQK
jgi:hypothetical protein